MKISMFYHSLISDWNNGHAHFLRGIVTELLQRGHQVKVYEDKNNWSLNNLLEHHGTSSLEELKEYYPHLKTNFYDLADIPLDNLLDKEDLVIVHEWNDLELIRQINRHKGKKGKYILLFHDTHHRLVTDRKSMDQYELSHFDGVLAFGNILRDLYRRELKIKNAWTWHEAADVRLFRPLPHPEFKGDLVWIGNWGDEERSEELHEFLIRPVKELGLKAKVFGVRYPDSALEALEKAGIEFGGWIPNYKVPEIFSQYRVTVHVPRRAYVNQLPGIPTIRPFEALSCGIPLISAPWKDVEKLFTSDHDYLVASNKEEMKQKLDKVLSSSSSFPLLHGPSESSINPTTNFRRKINKTILSKHTCAHRVDRLMEIIGSLLRESYKNSEQLKEEALATVVLTKDSHS